MPTTIGADRRSATTASGPPPSRLPVFGHVLSGVAEMAFGAGFLVTWYDPSLLGSAWVKLALEVMLLEFILIHSGPFLGMTSSRFAGSRKQWMATIGLALLYSLAVLGFCLGLKTWRPMLSFWLITGQRMAGHFFDPTPTGAAKTWYMTEIALSAVLYLLLVMFTTILPVPAFGISGAVSDVDSGGLWVDEPQRVVVLAGCYYLLRGYFTASVNPNKVGQWNTKAS